VTSVFAVEKSNPTNVIQSKHFIILNTNLLDAFFEFPASAGKTFLIFASGPNGTSRNLTALPAGAPQGCPLGNEQGVQVTFTCKGGVPAPSDTPPPKPFVANCRVERSSTGAFSLKIDGFNFREGQTLTVGGVTPKKLKFKNADASRPGFFTTIVAKGKVCNGLAGIIVVFDPTMGAGLPFACGKSCPE